jgi:hypothetical protein
MQSEEGEKGETDTPKKIPSLTELQSRLLSTPIQNENDALNVIVSFLNLAQRRGVFSIDESAKIWECIKSFQRG